MKKISLSLHVFFIALPFVLSRVLIIIFQRDSLGFVKPFLQITVGVLNDVYILGLMIFLLCFFRWLVLKLKNKVLLRVVKIFSFFLFLFVYFVLVANIIFVFYTGNNLSFYEITYLKDLGWLAGEPISLVLKEFKIVLFTLLCCFLMYYPLKSILYLLENLKFTRKNRVCFLGFFVFFLCSRSFSLSKRVVLHEPVETNIFTFLTWRAKYDKRHKISYPKEGFKNLSLYKEKIAKQRLVKAQVFDEKQNIVLLLLESFSLNKIKEKPEITPFLSYLMGSDPHTITFSKYFTTSYRTIGAQFALLCSQYDPLEFYVSRDYPTDKRTYCLTHVLASLGYENLWASGQNAEDDYNEQWLSNHGFSKTYTAKDFPSEEKAFSYGIHDDYVLEKLFGILDKQKEPFFTYFLSISNHYPYNLPKDFSLDPGSNFSPSEKAYYFTDLQLKKFFEEAKKKPWYKRTLFVVVGDHPHWGFNSKKAKEGESDYRPLSENFQTPAVFHHVNFKKKKISRITSSIDFAPTILALLGVKKETNFVGLNIFGPKFDRYIGSQDNTRSSYFNMLRDDHVIRCHHSLSPCVTAEKDKIALKPSSKEEIKRAKKFKEMFYDTTNWKFTKRAI